MSQAVLGSVDFLGGDVLPKGRQPDAMPLPSRLEAAVRNLDADRRHRDLITYVECWAGHEEPSPEARLAEARAFLALAQVDRAWIRLQDIADAEEASRDALCLAAELHLLRGWTAKARSYVKRALAHHPDDDQVQALWDRAAADTPEPGTGADVDDADELVALAEQHLARGHTVTARSLLDRALSTSPDHAHARDVRWAMDGMIEADAATLAELTDRHAPRRVQLGADLSDENTESITAEHVSDLLDEEDERGSSSFPSLFRGAGPEELDDETESTEEVTRVPRGLEARPSDRLDPDDATLDTFEDLDDEGGDTRIVRVRGRDGLPEEPPRMHRDPDSVDPDFDLDRFREEYGMSAAERQLNDVFGPDLEDEDDDLVQLTGRERREPSPVPPTAVDDPTASQIGREVAHLVGGRLPRTPAPPKGRRDPIADTPAPREAASKPVEAGPTAPPDEAPAPAPKGPDMRVWLVFAVVVGGLALFLAVVGLLIGVVLGS